MHETLIKTCPWEPAQWLIFSENVPTLLFYSHFTAILSALLIGTFILISAKNKLAAKLLSILFLLFSIWAVIDIAIWASNDPAVVLFWWSIIVLIEPIIYIVGFYTVFAFLFDRFPKFRTNIIVSLLLVPHIIFTPTDLNISAINLYDCDATEGALAYIYTYLLEFIFITAICAITFLRYRKLSNPREKKAVAFFTLGMIAFLIAFTSGNVIGSITENWNLAQYGLFGMPIFVGFLAYIIVEFKIYNITVIGSQVLIVSLWMLIGSMLFIAQSTQTKMVAAFTLIMSVALGMVLVRSVKRTIRQRDQIEKLASGLERANNRLRELDRQKSEFVSIASHQLRSPLTAMRGYASMLAEGSYGPVNEQQKDIMIRIQDSSRMMAESVEDFLSVSRIESGQMRYEYSEFNLREFAEHTVDDLRAEAVKQGLLLLYKTDLKGKGLVRGDKGKIQQILHNLINNALKYTPKGTITVYVHDDVKAKRLYVEFIDTGIGMSEATLHDLFLKFSRAKNANSVNIKGTGLGLFVARELARAMGGDITAHSEGDGKGSRFVLTLPYLG
jgi:signal transduction histidine kinase